MPTAPYSRLSARKGSEVRLEMDFSALGVLADPYAIRRINLYSNSVAEDNLVAQVDIPLPSDPSYPSPIMQVLDGNSLPIPGRYYYDFTVPDDVPTGSFIDEWMVVGDELVGADLTDETLWEGHCGRFIVSASEGWYGDDGLLTARFGFEPLDKNLTKPEVRWLEVGIVPLPLYDYSWNKIVPMIPQLRAYISIETLNGEVVVDEGAMELALRQGTHRTAPFVARYLMDTSIRHIATYAYYVKLILPNGESRVSQRLHFSIS